ncbi:MAG: HAD family phosphatase [Bacillota bacterium]|nr:HAD family phosphatase [Bacillota bacterium]
MIKNIVFDIGNVLVAFKPGEYVKSFGFEKSVEDKVLEAIFKSRHWPELDRGVLTEEEAVELFIKEAEELDLEIRNVMKSWKDMLIPIPDTIEILRELKNKGYKVYVLSNYHEKAFEKISIENDFLSLLDGEIVSCRLKYIKPEREIYEYLLSNYCLKPEETLFIDDVIENIEGAEVHGIKTVLFQGSAELRKYLYENNIL